MACCVSSSISYSTRPVVSNRLVTGFIVGSMLAGVSELLPLLAPRGRNNMIIVFWEVRSKSRASVESAMSLKPSVSFAPGRTLAMAMSMLSGERLGVVRHMASFMARIVVLLWTHTCHLLPVSDWSFGGHLLPEGDSIVSGHLTESV